jgi:hypothetical protein
MNMKRFFSLTLCLLALLTSRKAFSYEQSTQSKIVYKIIGEKSKLLAKRHKMCAIGDSVGMPSGVVHMLGGSFQKEKVRSLSEARRIIVDSGNEFLRAVNANEKLKPFLIKSPFTIENIRISIYLEANGFDITGNRLAVIGLSKGRIYYNYEGKVESRGYSKEIEETYEEALKKIQEEDQAST